MRAVIKKHLLAIGSYPLLALAFTWPLILKITTHFPSSDEWYGGDPNMYVWWMSWFAKAITGQTAVEPARMIFWPGGVNLWSGYDGIIMNVIGVPANLLTGNPVLSYNLVILSAFVAAAVAAYALGYALTRSAYAAWFSGFAFGFSTYLLVRGLQHPNLCLIFAIPLLFLAAWRFGEQPSWKNAWWLAGAVFLNGLTSFYYHVGAMVLVALMGFYYISKLIKKPWLLAGSAGLVGLAAALPALPILFQGTSGMRIYPESFVRNMGADPTNFLLPHPLTNVFGQLTQDAYNNLPTVFWGGYNLYEITSYFGLPLLILLAAWILWRKKIATPAAGFWLTIIPVFLILAFGVELRLGLWRIPMPLAWLRNFFPFSLVRSPNRMFIFALLATIILVACLLAYLEKNSRRRFLFVGLNIILFTALTAERLIMPYPTFANRVSDFYRQMGNDTETYAVADLPITYPGISEYDYFQLIHGKPIVDGEYFYTTYTKDTLALILANPLLLASVCEEGTPTEVVVADRDRTFRELALSGVRYVIVHNLLLANGQNCAYARAYIREFFSGLEPVFADGDITVYRVPPPETVPNS